MKIKSVQIGEFLKSLSDAEYEYLKISMNVRDGINSVIKKHNLSKEEVCKKFDIKEDGYENFIKGNYLYAISHMATINHLFIQYEEKVLLNNPPFNVAK